MSPKDTSSPRPYTPHTVWRVYWRETGGWVIQYTRPVCIEVSSHTAPKRVDREGPRKEDARKEDPEPLEHDLITPFKPN